MAKKEFDSTKDNSSRAGLTVIPDRSYPGQPQASKGIQPGGGGIVKKDYTTSKGKGS